MKSIATLLLGTCLLTIAGWTSAQSGNKTDTPQTPQTAMTKTEAPMTMQQCKDHMAMAKRTGTLQKDDAMMKREAACTDMMKKEAPGQQPATK